MATVINELLAQDAVSRAVTAHVVCERAADASSEREASLADLRHAVQTIVVAPRRAKPGCSRQYENFESGFSQSHFNSPFWGRSSAGIALCLMRFCAKQSCQPALFP